MVAGRLLGITRSEKEVLSPWKPAYDVRFFYSRSLFVIPGHFIIKETQSVLRGGSSRGWRREADGWVGGWLSGVFNHAFPTSATLLES